jgi:galactonate dehydratase
MVSDCEAIEKSLGRDFQIMLDLGGVFSVEGTLRLVQGLRGRNIGWIEEPVSALTLDAMSDLVAAKLNVPFSLGEHLCHRWDFKPAFEQKAADIVQPDVCHAGGISEIRRIAAMAEVFGVLVAPHNPWVRWPWPHRFTQRCHAEFHPEYCRRSPLFHQVQQGSKSGMALQSYPKHQGWE